MARSIDFLTPLSLGGARFHDIPFDAARFTGSGSIDWDIEAGDIQYERFRISGDSFTYQIAVSTGSTISGTGALLEIALPVTLSTGHNGLGYIGDTNGRHMATCSLSGSTLSISRFDQANYTTGITSLVVAIECPLA